MMRSIVAMLAVLGCGLASAPATAAGTSACADKPVFTERFAAPAIGARWTSIVHPSIANANGELQAYAAGALATGAQGLRIMATRAAAGYVSGRIASKLNFRYGCFDIVAQMPAGRGLWPALWLRTPYGLPIDGEIDIMEGFGSHPGVFQSTLHQWSAGVHHGFACTRIGDVGAAAFGRSTACTWQPRSWPANFTTTPHHYALVWTPRAVTWLIDGTPYYTLHAGIPNQAMAIQINLAVGGVFDGDPDAGTMFPAAMTVKSVTVWGLKP